MWAEPKISGGTPLVDGSPEAVGLAAAPLRALRTQLRGWLAPRPETGRPGYAGAVCLLAVAGTVIERVAVGNALRYADSGGTQLPPDEWMPMRDDTIFDLASLSKVFTSIVVLQLIESGLVDPYAPVAGYVPEFAAGGKSGVTVQQLLTHTSGLGAEPEPPLWRGYATYAERVAAFTRAPLEATPGSAYRYSDLNMMNLGRLAERVTGRALDALVYDGITSPLGMRDTWYDPPGSVRHRIAATEFQCGSGSAGRGLVWGEVHDENAWALHGVAGHAGVFSTADDLAKLGHALLEGGCYAGGRVLDGHSVEQVFTDHNARFPGCAHGLGFELDRPSYMGGLASADTAGHTGFTGTSMIVDRRRRAIAILLTNRVHPSRAWSDIAAARRAAATQLMVAFGP